MGGFARVALLVQSIDCWQNVDVRSGQASLPTYMLVSMSVSTLLLQVKTTDACLKQYRCMSKMLCIINDELKACYNCSKLQNTALE